MNSDPRGVRPCRKVDRRSQAIGIQFPVGGVARIEGGNGALGQMRLHFGWPVLFRQLRPGLGGALFTIYKFRTMRDELDSAGRALADQQRLTSVGRLVRSTSLDELPELWHVVRGEMSLVAPRPLLPEYLPRYTERQARRHDVRPGITGWAQVNGRNALAWDKKFELDVWFITMLTPTAACRTFPTSRAEIGRCLPNALR